VHGAGNSPAQMYCVGEIMGEPTTRFMTEAVQSTSHPVWQDVNEIMGVEPAHTIDFSLFATMGTQESDVLLGKASLCSSHYWPMGFEGELLLSGNTGCSGSLRVQISVEADGRELLVTPRAKATSAFHVPMTPSLPEFQTIRVSLIGVRGVKTAVDNVSPKLDSLVFGDPRWGVFCECEISGSKFQTEVASGCADPEWNLTTEISQVTAGETLDFAVYRRFEEADTVELLGQASLGSDEFFPSGWSGELDLTHEGQNSTCFLRVNVAVMPEGATLGEQDHDVSLLQGIADINEDISDVPKRLTVQPQQGVTDSRTLLAAGRLIGERKISREEAMASSNLKEEPMGAPLLLPYHQNSQPLPLPLPRPTVTLTASQRTHVPATRQLVLPQNFISPACSVVAPASSPSAFSQSMGAVFVSLPPTPATTWQPNCMAAPVAAFPAPLRSQFVATAAPPTYHRAC